MALLKPPLSYESAHAFNDPLYDFTCERPFTTIEFQCLAFGAKFISI